MPRGNSQGAIASSSKPPFRRRFVGCCGPLEVVVDGSTDMVDGSADVVAMIEITVDSDVGTMDSVMDSVLLIATAEETEETECLHGDARAYWHRASSCSYVSFMMVVAILRRRKFAKGLRRMNREGENKNGLFMPQATAGPFQSV